MLIARPSAVESLGGVRPEIVAAIDAAMGKCLTETNLKLPGLSAHAYMVLLAKQSGIVSFCFCKVGFGGFLMGFPWYKSNSVRLCQVCQVSGCRLYMSLVNGGRTRLRSL